MNIRPTAWMYTDRWGTHFAEEEREVLDGVGIESCTPMLSEHDVATHVNALTHALDATQTALGNAVNRTNRMAALLRTIKNSHVNGVGWAAEISEVLDDGERT